MFHVAPPLMFTLTSFPKCCHCATSIMHFSTLHLYNQREKVMSNFDLFSMYCCYLATFLTRDSDVFVDRLRYIKAWLNLFLTKLFVIFVMLYFCTYKCHRVLVWTCPPVWIHKASQFTTPIYHTMSKKTFSYQNSQQVSISDKHSLGFPELFSWIVSRCPGSIRRPLPIAFQLLAIGIISVSLS